MTRRALAGAIVLLLAAAPVRSEPTVVVGPPAELLSGEPVAGAALEEVLGVLRVPRLAATFVEEKHSALLARPISTSGTLHYDRARGIVRTVTAPRPQQIVLTGDTLTIRKGTRVETIPLAKSKSLQSFALVFPTLLRGDRAALDRAFSLVVRGSAKGWWALSLTPREAALQKLVRSVGVIGHGGTVHQLRVEEASGDRSETRLSDLRTGDAVAEAELARAFEAR